MKQKETAIEAKGNASIDSVTVNSQLSVSQFLVNKKKMTPSWLNKLKEAEVKFVVGGNASRNYLDDSFFSFRYTFIQKCWTYRSYKSCSNLY